MHCTYVYNSTKPMELKVKNLCNPLHLRFVIRVEQTVYAKAIKDSKGVTAFPLQTSELNSQIAAANKVLTPISQSFNRSDATRNKLLGAPGLTTRSKDATRGSWPYYSKKLLGAFQGTSFNSVLSGTTWTCPDFLLSHRWRWHASLP